MSVVLKLGATQVMTIAADDAITAHNNHMAVRAGLHDPGQGAHKDVVAAIRFKIAVDKGQDLITGRQHGAVLQCQGSRWIGGHLGGINPVMKYLQTVAMPFGEAAALPLGRAVADITGFQRQ